MKRTPLAVALVAAAVGVPAGAWWVVGSREAEREAARLLARPRAEAEAAAAALAASVSARLDALQAAEAERPILHYQHLWHDPRGAAKGPAVVPSPLAEGPPDPLVLAYFQVGADGRLTLPTLNEGVPDANFNADVPGQQRLQATLQAAAASCTVPPQVEEADEAPLEGKNRAKAWPMQQEAWVQNARANQIYDDLKQQRDVVEPAQTDETIVARSGAFEWRTVALDGRPALVSVRAVETPDGPRTQGFVIATGAVAALLAGAPYPASFATGPAEEGVAAPLGLVGPAAGWQVRIDPGLAVAAAAREADAVHRRFRTTFALGLLAAVLAGASVAALVWHTERLAAQRAQFAAAAAHELRTPLAGLRMYGEMLAEGLGDPTRAAEYARRIATEAERLGRVVTNVLGFTRLERGTLAVHPVPADLGAIVADTVARQRPTLEAAGLAVTCDVAPGLPPVAVDPDAVVQVVQNLLDNAEKYTRCRDSRCARISVGEAPGGGVRVTVADDGPGVPPALARRLFRPFVRGDDPDAPAGLGLGLALTKALVEAQGATVAYKPAVEGGADFTIDFSAGAIPAPQAHGVPESR